MKSILGGSVVLFSLYFLASIALVLFSYTQVDLSLTLSRASFVQSVQKQFQHIGFYERQASTGIFVLILFLFFALYGRVIYLANKKKIPSGEIWVLAGLIAGILFFSYSAAFSYDIFNYIFTAKTVLLYGKNPYIVTPLQFQGIDPMLSFMRWTHLPSAYTPLWILFTLPFYLLSFGSILFSLWMMKIIPIGAYFLTIWGIERLLKKEDSQRQSVGMVLYALNPLVIIEVLVSGHNDSMMMGLSLLGMVYALERKPFASFFAVSLSVATKLMTIVLAPLSFVGFRPLRAFVLMCGGLVIVLLRREFVPWYFLWIAPFGALLPGLYWVQWVLVGISMGLLSRYTHVFYFGGNAQGFAQIQMRILIGFVVLTCMAGVVWRKYKKRFLV